MGALPILISSLCWYDMKHKKKNRTRGTILKTQMMKKNLLLLSDSLKSRVKVQIDLETAK